MANYDVESHTQSHKHTITHTNIPDTEECFVFYFWHPMLVRPVVKRLFFPWKTKGKEARFARAPHDNNTLPGKKISARGTSPQHHKQAAASCCSAAEGGERVDSSPADGLGSHNSAATAEMLPNLARTHVDAPSFVCTARLTP